MLQQVLVPSLGESILTAKIAKLLKNSNTFVQKDEIILELETEKITLEIVAPCSGLLTIVVSENDEVKVKQVLATIDNSQVDAKHIVNTNNEVENNEQEKAESDQRRINAQLSKSPENILTYPKSSAIEDFITNIPPSSRHHGVYEKNSTLSHYNGVDLSPNDINAKPLEDDNNIEIVEMSVIRKTIAKRLKAAQNTAAILTTFNKIDMSAVLKIREFYGKHFQDKHGVKLGFMSFFIKASVLALKTIPIINAKIIEEQIVYQHFYNIGVAIGLDGALVVPTIYRCENLNFAQVEMEILTLSEKARNKQLSPKDLMNATFSITNGGIYGSLFSTPIINPPQSAILGMHKIEKMPVVIDDKIEIRPMMYVALSYDHRIIDGKDAVIFLTKIKEAVEKPEVMLLDI